MKSFIYRRGLSFWAVMSSALLLLAALWVVLANNAFANSENTSPNGRLVTIYDRGSKTSLVTNALTIGDALEDAGVWVDKNDVVEPGLGEEILSSDYRINIYRARPVVVVDGYTRSKIMTPYQTAERIVEHAGIDLRSEDKAVIERVDDIVAEGAGLRLTIYRAVPITLTINGNSTEIYTVGPTVADMLLEKNISLGSKDTISPGLDQPIESDQKIVIWHSGVQTVSLEESIDFAIETIQDADRPVGYKQVKTKGQKGLRVTTYELLIEDGKQVNKKEIVSLVTRQPVKQVEVIGIKRDIYTTPSENEKIAWEFFITQGFTPEQTAGIMGNLAQEHGFKTADVPGGLGIAQWLGNRRVALLNRSDPYSIYTQLEFIIHELNTTEGRAKNALLAAGTVEQATLVFQNLYERCNPVYCNLERRTGFAYSILARYN